MPDGIRSRFHSSRRILPAASPARGLAAAGLQPVVELESAGAVALLPHRRPGLVALPQPDRGPVAADRLVRAAGRPGLHGRVHRRPGRVRRLHGRQGRALVRPTSTARRSRDRSPTSAPSTASTRAWASTPAAWACWPAITSRSASDMAMPFLGVGLLYKHGYFRQTIDADGHQEHAYPDFDLTRLPIRRVVEPRRRPPHGSPGAAGAAAGPWPCGASRWAACRCCCWTRTSRTTTNRTGRSPTSCTSAAARCASTRSWCWASAACGPSGRWASSRRSGTSTRATPPSCWSSAPGPSSRREWPWKRP